MPPRLSLPSPTVGRLLSRPQPLLFTRSSCQQQHQHQPPLCCCCRRHASSSSTGVTATAATVESPKVIFSGIQPTGVPHLGNYLGALKNWVRLQDEESSGGGGAGGGGGRRTASKLLYSVVDLHAITVPQQDAAALRRQRREMLAALLAVGLDPARSIIFYQSSVPAHTELMWILSCTASMGYLSRMTQWKSKLSLSEDTGALDDKAKTALKLGLFSYPVLQAADIMVHRATHVPVGEDQKQHLEFARECATGFNATYGTSVLVPPETILSPARRVMSLTNPTAKMSKSDANPSSRILLTDEPDAIRKKIARALTDSDVNAVTYDPAARPGVSNLLEMLTLLDGEEGRSSSSSSSETESAAAAATTTPAETARQFHGVPRPLKALKERVAEAIVREFGDVRDRYRELLERRGGAWLDEIEAEGAAKAQANADATMKRVKEAVGL